MPAPSSDRDAPPAPGEQGALFEDLPEVNAEADDSLPFPSAALVVFNLPLPPLTYGVREAVRDQMEVGALVEARLRGRLEVGCIVELHDGAGGAALLRDLKRVQPVSRRVTPGFALTAELIALARWMSDYYMASLGECLACLSFIGFHDLPGPRPQAGWRLREGGGDASGLTKRQRQVIDWMRARSADGAPVPKSALHDELGVTDGVLKRLTDAGLVEPCRIEPPPPVALPDPIPLPACLPPAAAHTLTDDQTSALRAVSHAIAERRYATFLLQGITGSGKTEVYLRALGQVLAQGRTGVVLVPEIALTPQTVARFRERFGTAVGVYHSRLTLREKLDLYRAIGAGQVRVVIGARSALFAPLHDLGLIVVDEEHETTYKQDSAPRYHARDVAILRASRVGAAVVLGSATPSLESAFNAEAGKYHPLRLTTRIGASVLPSVELVDLGREAREGGLEGHLSRPLRQAMAESLERGEHCLLLLNRRGYTSFFQCPACRATLQCPHCDVTLTHHKRDERLECHLCGHQQPIPTACPSCHHPEMNRIGLGTERLEEELARLFPGRTLMRLDQDTTQGKGRWDDIWRALEAGEAEILCGTQMIAKGLHLERITCVGVVLADITLTQPDFRAQERTFALITQVAGRAGRGAAAGKVFVQTYQPWHYAVRLAAAHDYALFYDEELRRRRVASFPPIQRLIAITIASDDLDAARQHAEALAGLMRLRQRAEGGNAFAIFGPTPAPVARIKDLWRWRLLLRGASGGALRAHLRAALDDGRMQFLPAWKSHRLTIDVDPMDLM